MSIIRDIENEDSFKGLTKDLPPQTLLIIFFSASWAAPCKQVYAILEALASQYKEQATDRNQPPASSKVEFIRIDAEQVPDISEAYDVTAVPLIVLEREGKLLESISGTNASRLRSVVEKHAGCTLSEPLPEQRDQGSTSGTVSSQTEDNADEPAGLDAQLRERLIGLTKAAPVMLFMKGSPSAPECGFSRQLVAILRERSVRYGFFNILADDSVRQGLKELSEWPTFPQLYVKGELIGGLDIVKEELEQEPNFFASFSVE